MTLDKRSYQALAAVTEEQRSVIEVRWLAGVLLGSVAMLDDVLPAAWGGPAGDCLSRASTCNRCNKFAIVAQKPSS